MIRTTIITILAIGFIGVSYWGYHENVDKKNLMIHAENNYQRAFHELTYNMDLLHDKIGTSLAMNSGERISPQFVDIWKLASVASSNVSQLPLGLLPFERTNEFLANIGEFTYQTAVRNLDDEPLSRKELETLQQYNEQAAAIKDELRQAQHLTLENNLRWMDVELALVSNDNAQNSIIDGFRTVEDGVGKFADGMNGVNTMNSSKEAKGFEHLTGKNTSEQELRNIVKKMVEIKDDSSMNVTESSEAAQVPNYNVTYKDEDKNVFLDITKQGAHPITLLVNRPIKAQKLSLNDGLLEAEKYLDELAYSEMTLLESKQFDNVGMFTFIKMKDEVRVFSDKVVVKVALDNGEVIGLNARDYLKNHQNRSIPKAGLSLEEARKFVNKNVDIQAEHLAVIINNLGEEVLVYEFLAVLQDETYRIFINAQDGTEEKIEKLTDTETNFEANI